MIGYLIRSMLRMLFSHALYCIMVYHTMQGAKRAAFPSPEGGGNAARSSKWAYRPYFAGKDFGWYSHHPKIVLRLDRAAWEG